MDILDKVKLFINDSIRSLFAQQKEDLSLVIHKESATIIADVKAFVSEQAQMNERDMANMLQNVFSLNKELQAIASKLESVQQTLERLEERQMTKTKEDNEEVFPTPAPLISVFYAKMVDSNSPLGFKLGNLKDTDEGCAFLITLKDGREGTYEFIDDVGIKQEMLAAFNPLISDSSTYDEIPQSPTMIEVLEKGVIIKEENVLRIVEKQKIKIY